MIENSVPEDFKFFSDERQPDPNPDFENLDAPESTPIDIWEE